MNYLIWYNPKTGYYDHGTEADLSVNQSLAGEELAVLYEMEETEVSLVKKIAAQLNNARQEQRMTQGVLR